MNELAYLLCDILGENEQGWYKLRSWLEDETTFEIAAPKHIVNVIESGGSKQGYLHVEYSGERNGRASITLPYPNLTHGNRVTISTKYLDRP